jgi:PAS domain S-box-containing protein
MAHVQAESRLKSSAEEKFQQKLREIIQGTSPIIGEYYFQSLVKQVSEALQFRYAMIGKIASAKHIQTVAFAIDGQIQKNVTYAVDGTPCENVIKGKLCLYPEGVQKRFPRDKDLARMNVEGYMGIPLMNPQSGKVVGLLAVLDDSPMLDLTSVHAILKIFGGRAEAEFDRLRNEQGLKQILNSIGEGVCGLDLEGNITFVNPAGAGMIGYGVEELIGRDVHVVQHHSKPDGSACPKEECQVCAALKDGKVHRGDRESFLRKDGTSFPVEYVSTPIFEEEGLQGAVITFKNIAERKEYEVKLLESEERLNGILNYSPTVIYLKDTEGRYMVINHQYEKLIDLTSDEVMGKTDLDFFPKDIAENFMANDRQVLKAGGPLEFEERAPHRDGYHTYISTKFPLRDSRGEIYGLFGISLDITQRKQTEKQLKISREQLLHAEKLSAIGKLSASIAHEFNNPIYGIRNVLEKIMEEVNLSGRQQSFVNLAIQECDRIKGLIMKMQDFNRPSSEQFELFDLHGAIDDMLRLMKQKFKEKGVQLEKKYASNLPRICGISDQVKQVILNLLKNAEDAISGPGGKVSVTTRLRSLWVEMEVEDNGAGISPQNIDAIFEPFFTTKSAVKGTGLGLSVSYGIVKAHGGTIKVNSAEGKGARFLVTLPLRPNAA